jgi:DNA polymerase sigma
MVTEEDLNKAKDSLLEKIFQKGIEDIENRIDGDSMIAKSAVQKEIIELKTSGENEKEMDNFEMEIRAKIIAMSFNKKEAEELIFTKLNDELSQEKFFIDSSIENGVDFEGIDFNIEHKQLNLKLHINKEVAWKIDEKIIKKAIKGKNREETVKYLLENSTGKEVKVDFWPFWVEKVPQIEKKIKIILDT